MWKAIAAFDPQADRWAEPVSFGDREERIRTARLAVAGLKANAGLEPALTKDIDDFCERLAGLMLGREFGPPEAQFSQYLRDKGRHLVRDGVVEYDVVEQST